MTPETDSNDDLNGKRKVNKVSNVPQKATGLKAESVIRLDKIATVLKDLILGELGELDEELKKEVNQKLKRIMVI